MVNMKTRKTVACKQIDKRENRIHRFVRGKTMGLPWSPEYLSIILIATFYTNKTHNFIKQEKET